MGSVRAEGVARTHTRCGKAREADAAHGARDARTETRAPIAHARSEHLSGARDREIDAHLSDVGLARHAGQHAVDLSVHHARHLLWAQARHASASALDVP